ncbi:hypothetical protein MMP65_14095 [Acinetobacter sp. ANC 3926]|uniref:Competence protein n=1 Tax=Acinetobacter genomosp. 15BJ TaxID=106651 RepID=R9AQI9_9GAMM|nr:competence protein CoiA family protein [Acinetobacter genomosp. 15BJ]EOR02341.1 hypothetical protein F896_04028 [Acinetobacter genomosp. 15BJ]MCH7292580.1 hypothetical protein [Acinetobacter genomosp. 15BJ]
MNFTEQHCFGFALNQQGQLVTIDQAIQWRQKGLKPSYYCPNSECSGELVTVLGKVRINHFRHKTSFCNLETLQHQLAKQIIAQSIINQKQISLLFNCAVCHKNTYEWAMPPRINHE